MSGVANRPVEADDDGVRLDRWFKRHYPQVTHGQLQKLLRKGQVRVDGKRVKGNARLATGQVVRVPPLSDAPPAKAAPRPPSDRDADDLRARVLHRDDLVIVLDKPPGLAVQGGSGTRKHLDGMLDALRFGAKDRPRLVHRLDKDTSGVLVLGRTAGAAAKLTAAFRSKEARKLYWALVAGVPKPAQGLIDQPLAKLPGKRGEKVVIDDDFGKRATTLYRIVEKAGRQAAWLAMEPLTGRTHQLRVHAAQVLETPIVGDGKYGGKEAFLEAEGVSGKLHLHARAIRLPHPGGGRLEVAAPLPAHMKASWGFLGFDEGDPEAGFSELEE